MNIYPLTDPDRFFAILPAMPRQAEARRAVGDQFDEYGYMMGEQGARISPAHLWSNRTSEDPYDVDLSVNVIWLPSMSLAKEGFSRTAERLKLPGPRVSDLPPIALHAEDSRFIRIRQRAAAIYQLDARYGNYLFTFTARLADSGYFPTEEILVGRLQALDDHIHGTLQEVA